MVRATGPAPIDVIDGTTHKRPASVQGREIQKGKRSTTARNAVTLAKLKTGAEDAGR